MKEEKMLDIKKKAKVAEQDILIHADKRENSSHIIKILQKRCKVEEKMLDIADYQLSNRTVVERKTVPDFLQSIIDGRLFSQLKDMKKKYARPVLLIEGEDSLHELRDINPNAINGALASIAIDMQIPILWTKSQHETAELLFGIARREQLGGKKNERIRMKPKTKSTNHEQEFLIAGLPGVSTMTAKALLKHFGTPKGIMSASMEDLTQVEGIGKITAKRISALLAKKYEKSILED